MSRPIRVRNRTPHDPLRIWRGDDLLIALPAEGPATRLAEATFPAAPIELPEGEIPTVQVEYGEVFDIPGPTPDTIIVVSQLVCRALPKRRDLYFPTDLKRDGSGNIIGCSALGQMPKQGTAS